MNVTLPYELVAISVAITYIYLACRFIDKVKGWLLYVGFLVGVPILILLISVVLEWIGIHVDASSNGECVEWSWWGDCTRIVP